MARSAVIAAPLEQVFSQVNDLPSWEAWSPWLKADPAARTAYEGPPAGPGAAFTWSGNGQVGEGRMTKRPFSSTSTAEFTFVTDGARTVVTWSMTGEKNFLAEALHMVMNMDTMIGGTFDEGLAQMKAIAESTART